MNSLWQRLIPFVIGLAVVLVLRWLSKNKFRPATYEMSLEEEGYLVEYQPGSKKTPSRLTFSIKDSQRRDPTAGKGMVPYRSGPKGPEILTYVSPLVLRKETKWDRLGKALGLNREVQTREASFDRAVYIETDAPAPLVRKILDDEKVRSQVHQWLDDGWEKVVFFGMGTSVGLEKRGVAKPQALDPRCQQWMRELSSVSRRLPQVRYEHIRMAPWTRRDWAKTISAGLAVLGVTATVVAREAYPPLFWRPFEVCIGLGVVGWLAAVPLLALAFRGRSDSLRVFGTCSLLLALGLPTTMYGLGLGLNGLLDGSPAVVKQLAVEKAWATRSKSTSYHVTLKHWNEWVEPFSLQIDGSTYYGIQRHLPPQYVALTIRGGGFGVAVVDAS